MKKALIIFVRNPVLGKVKTRLAKTMGDRNALKVYQKLLLHTRAIIEKINCDKFIFYADEINNNDDWPNNKYIKNQQITGTLGEKMAGAFEFVFSQGYNRTLIIGSDCYDLTASIIEEGFIAMEKYDVVLGPASDGGYYLLGKKVIHPSLFAIAEWSTNTVLCETIAACNKAGLSFTKLEVLNDVDEEKDVNFYY